MQQDQLLLAPCLCTLFQSPLVDSAYTWHTWQARGAIMGLDHARQANMKPWSNITCAATNTGPLVRRNGDVPYMSAVETMFKEQPIGVRIAPDPRIRTGKENQGKLIRRCSLIRLDRAYNHPDIAHCYGFLKTRLRGKGPITWRPSLHVPAEDAFERCDAFYAISGQTDGIINCHDDFMV